MHRMLSSPLILIPLQAGTIQVETREVQASNTRDLPFPVAPMRFIGFIGNIDNVNMTGTIQVLFLHPSSEIHARKLTL